MAHGPQYLSAMLTEHGHEHEVMFINHDSAIARIVEYKPEILGISCTSFDFPRIRQLAGEVKGHIPTDVILGGAHTMVCPHSLLDSNCDEYCSSEGEYPFLNLVEGRPMGKRVIEDMDSELPNYIKGRLPLQEIVNDHDGWLNVMVSRGCPYSCTFCVNPILRQRFCGKNFYRTMSPQVAIDHLIALIKTIDEVRVLNFDDDNLGVWRPWLYEFLKLYEQQIFYPYSTSYVLNARAPDVDEYLVGLLKKSGCYELQMSVETGDERLRNELLDKRITNKDLEYAFDTCHEQGIRTLAYVMHGLPFSNGTTPYTTADLILRLSPTMVRDTYFYPFEGSQLRKQCDVAGIPIKQYPQNIFEESAIPGHDDDRERFQEVVGKDYRRCPRNMRYLERWDNTNA